MRQAVGLKPDRLPYENTIFKFRHFLVRHGFDKVLLQKVNKYLEKNGLMLREGSIVDATIISAPSSTQKKRARPGDASSLGKLVDTRPR